MSDEMILRIDGNVERPLRLTFADLAGFPESAQVRDVSRFHSTRKGDGVSFDALLERAGVLPTANYLTLHADRDDFHVSVPLEPLRGQGIVVYRLGPGPLGLEHGGPIRFLIRDPAACHTDQLDECANVKYLKPHRADRKARAGHATG